MSNLYRSISRYLADSKIPASTLERDAGLGNGFLSKIRNGSIPGEKSLLALLSAIPRDEAADCLRSHLLDCTPEDWRPHTHIRITPPVFSSRLQDTRPSLDPSAPDAYDRALEILAAAGTSPKVRKHIINFVRDFVSV